jgi:glutamate decarboxylase
MEKGRYVITPEQVVAAANENTIGVVAILGTTFTGELEPVAEISAALDAHAPGGGPPVPIHVDGASGGLVVPLQHPAVEWDFRLPRVVSINASGHKYGLTYPGIGFVVWRSPEHLPEDLVFRVNYLGGDMPTFTLNFSRPGNQVIGQYYNFLRLGRPGYRAIMETLRDTAVEISARLAAIPQLSVITDGSAIPVISVEVAADAGFTVFDVSHELRAGGWQVPAYTMPADAEDVAVLRIVVRDGFNSELGRMLTDAVTTACRELSERDAGARAQRSHFAH